jgi:hypothetical protein
MDGYLTRIQFHFPDDTKHYTVGVPTDCALLAFGRSTLGMALLKAWRLQTKARDDHDDDDDDKINDDYWAFEWLLDGCNDDDDDDGGEAATTLTTTPTMTPG